MRFQGTVTQSGVMGDGHRFRAVQAIDLELSCPDDAEQAVECTIRRTERAKTVDETSLPSPELPLYLQQYLSSFGSCLEKATGRWYRPEGLIMLTESERPAVLTPSDVLWSRHTYMLLLEADGVVLSGFAINMDDLADRTEDQGRLEARLCDSSKKLVQCVLRTEKAGAVCS
jgi:hypothetical protein